MNTIDSKPKTEARIIDFKVVHPHEVRAFLIEQFFTHELKRAAQTPGNIIYTLIDKLAERPLFHYSGNKLARLVFSSWYGLLDLRNAAYTHHLQRDLYLLHELFHMATINYAKMTDDEWSAEHIRKGQFALV
jgi:hypothetical protein